MYAGGDWITGNPLPLARTIQVLLFMRRQAGVLNVSVLCMHTCRHAYMQACMQTWTVKNVQYMVIVLGRISQRTPRGARHVSKGTYLGIVLQ